MQLELTTSRPEGPGIAVTANKGRLPRDVRLDFFRGLALVFIFIDHVPGNSLAHATMRALGLSDAAEVFVLIAGFAAFLAYSGPIERDGIKIGSLRILKRIRDLFAAHIILVTLCGALLAVAARTFENPLYFEDVNLTPLAYDPAGAIWRLLVLYYQPGYMNILPLYIVLLAWLPAFLWLLQRNAAFAMATSVTIWFAASFGRINLPSWPEVYGWYFNPFAWQLLFSIGAFAAFQARRGAVLLRSPVLVAASLAVVAVGFVVAAPWINIPTLDLPRIVAFDALGYVSKTNLSLWRLAHILSVAYLTALIVPASARWLQSKAAQLLVNCGQNGLDIFCLGTVLSFVGIAVMLEGGRSWEFQLLVNGFGIGGMVCAGLWLTSRKTRRAAASSRKAASGLAATGTVASGLAAKPAE